MIVADETFDGTWPYAAQFFSGNGSRHWVTCSSKAARSTATA